MKPSKAIATIASGATTSNEIDIAGATILGFIFPAALTGATIGLEMSDEAGGTFVTVGDGAGGDLSVTFTASQYEPITNLALTKGITHFKVVSASSEGADREIKVVTGSID